MMDLQWNVTITADWVVCLFVFALRAAAGRGRGVRYSKLFPIRKHNSTRGSTE